MRRLGKIMISRVIIGYGDAAHTGSVGCEYAFLRVFKDDTLGRNDVKTISGFKKNIRRRLHSGNIQAADDGFKIVGDAEAVNDAVNRVAIGRGCEGDAHLAG